MIEVTQMKRVSKDNRKVIFSDTDTLSSFLWRNAFGYFMKLFDKLGMEVIIPQVVLDELEYSARTREHLARPIINLEKQGRLQIQDIIVGSGEYRTYCYLKEEEDFGKGEAAALSMATHSDYTASVASNNLSDIWEYVEKNKIDLWTTARIIYECELNEIISNSRAEDLWKKMLEDGLKLPFENYSDYVKNL